MSEPTSAVHVTTKDSDGNTLGSWTTHESGQHIPDGEHSNVQDLSAGASAEDVFEDPPVDPRDELVEDIEPEEGENPDEDGDIPGTGEDADWDA